MELERLARQLEAAKEAERLANANRLEVERQILALFQEQSEGTTTEAFPGGKIKITWKLTRKVDTASLQTAWESISETARKCFKWEAGIDLKSLRAMQELDAEAYKAAARFIEAKPAKPTITLETE